MVATGGIVRCFGIFTAFIPSHDDEGIKIEGRAFNTVHRVVAIGIIGIGDAVWMFAICGERDHVCGFFHDKSCRSVEDVFAEVENEHGEYEIEPILFGSAGNNIGDAFVKELHLVYDPCTHGRVVLKHFFESKGIRDAGNIVSQFDIPSPVRDGFGGTVLKALVIDL